MPSLQHLWLGGQLFIYSAHDVIFRSNPVSCHSMHADQSISALRPYDEQTLNGIARHYQTGAPMPGDLRARLLATRNFRCASERMLPWAPCTGLWSRPAPRRVRSMDAIRAQASQAGAPQRMLTGPCSQQNRTSCPCNMLMGSADVAACSPLPGGTAQT